LPSTDSTKRINNGILSNDTVIRLLHSK
jgi:hypothetical protein